MKSLKNKYNGQTLTIVGKGPSLQYVHRDDFASGPVITLNQAILAIEPLNLPNPTYSMQKDGGAKRHGKKEHKLIPDCAYSPECGDKCGDMIRPQKATLLVHKHESLYCFPDYSPRLVFDCAEFGLENNTISLMVAIKIGELMGCTKFVFIACDSYTTQCYEEFMPVDKNVEYEEPEIYEANSRAQKLKRNYKAQVAKTKPYIDNINCEWITPIEKLHIKKDIHLIMPFMRHENKDKLINAYASMDIILHPIMFLDEITEFNEFWIHPVIIPMVAKDCTVKMIECFKKNWFIEKCLINNEDYYCTADDDDMYEDGVFDSIKKLDDDIVIISLKRGDFIPKGIKDVRKYPTSTLYAHPDNVQIGLISGQQSFVKGHIFKKNLFDSESKSYDGEMAIHHKESGEQIRYEPDLFALFNYYEPGRWAENNIMFGCMVNDAKRLNLILRNSSIGDIPCYTINDPESATKGLNTLLDIFEKKGAAIGILTHQDMYYREGWMQNVKEQIEKLPEDWVIAGIVGKDETGKLCGRFHDMSSPLWIVSEHEFPVRCSCIDECTIIVNMKSGFRFEEELEGFDLYGTYACLRANELGSAWIIDAWAEHYCTRFHREWEPSEVFMRMWKWIYERFPGKRLDSTVLVGEENTI